MPKVSVCIATFNGEKYIKEQLDSILKQLQKNDELIISDDSSTDSTIKIIETFNDPRIKIYKNQKFRNPIFNFENAIKMSTGDYIFLSDQDDLWLGSKTETMCQYLQDYHLVLSNCSIIDSQGALVEKSFFSVNKSGRGFWKNVMKNSYLGCCLALRRSVLEKAMPFPKDIPMHDWWIGLICECFFRIKIIDDPLVFYRKHGANATPNTGGKSNISYIKRFSFRFALLKGIIKVWLKS